MADMQELIARLEDAEAGSRELDAAIFRYFGEPVPTEFAGRGIKLEWQDDGTAVMPIGDMHVRYSPPSYSTSLDAALALAERVLPSWRVFGISDERDSQVNSGWAAGICELRGPGIQHARTWTPALAICIAILKAKAQGEGG
jgi:hypothetical protein